LRYLPKIGQQRETKRAHGCAAHALLQLLDAPHGLRRGKEEEVELHEVLERGEDGVTVLVGDLQRLIEPLGHAPLVHCAGSGALPRPVSAGSVVLVHIELPTLLAHVASHHVAHLVVHGEETAEGMLRTDSLLDERLVRLVGHVYVHDERPDHLLLHLRRCAVIQPVSRLRCIAVLIDDQPHLALLGVLNVGQCPAETRRSQGRLAVTKPRHATPRHATPRTPRHATPRHATPRHATPRRDATRMI
jgi:hypothetical protein